MVPSLVKTLNLTAELTGERILKVDQYLAKSWTEVPRRIRFLDHTVEKRECHCFIFCVVQSRNVFSIFL